MKISIKWIFVATALLCIPMSLSQSSTFTLVGICGLLMLAMLPFVVFMQWKIDDEEGWWKFKGHPIARLAVWAYAISATLIVLCVLRVAIFGNNLR